MIKEINIVNFKCFKGTFNLKLNNGLNILVGDNEAGKSTILEAIHIALTGLLHGRYLKNELSQYLFNNEVVSDYIEKIAQKVPVSPPYVLIEVFFSSGDFPLLEGDGNSLRKKESGVSLKIGFDSKYQNEYEALVKSGDVKTVPIEYYDVFWTSCARDNITSKSIPVKSAFIDSSNTRYQNGSDVYISRIIRDFLSPDDIISVTQAHRKMRDAFIADTAIQGINSKIKTAANISNKDVSISVDLSSRNNWEGNLVTYLDSVPFHHVGKGEQCIIKTKLALSHKKSVEANILLLEEPENHLSHSKLNQLLYEIKSNSSGKQVIISTHSSFVANKLGLNNLIFLHAGNTVKLDQLKPETKSFFEKLSGYDTLRLILCKKAILVEGDSDELVIQKAYMMNKNNKLPIEDGIDIISVGTSFLRFLEIAEKLNKSVTVVTDNDGDVNALKKKYCVYLDDSAPTKDFISICFDTVEDSGNLKIGNKPFNYNTLEPKFVKANNLDVMNSVLGTTYEEIDDLHKYMKANKTDCALKVFDTSETVAFPQYILDAIK